jgi:hypothetical protein
MRGSPGIDVTPSPEQIAELIGKVPCTRGWALRSRGGNFFEIHGPHPDYPDKAHYRVGIADITAPRATAIRIFATMVAAGRDGSHEECGCR